MYYIVLFFSYALSDALSELLEFEITSSHLPAVSKYIPQMITLDAIAPSHRNRHRQGNSYGSQSGNASSTFSSRDIRYRDKVCVVIDFVFLSKPWFTRVWL